MPTEPLPAYYSATVSRRTAVAIGLLFAAIFLLHALSYLFFFVDDEGIPFVYARNLLRSHQLAYNSFEGPVEGYSDFLHVFVAAALLLAARGAGADQVAVFFAGKALSLAAGVGVVVTVLATLDRLGARLPNLVAGLTFVALAGPLAIWSCSSLEFAMVALLVALLTHALVAGESHDGRALAFSALLVLERIDGFIYAGAIVLSFVLLADRARRRALIVHTVVPLAAIFVAYHGWRWWYFGDLESAPVYAKIAPRLLHGPNVVTRLPQTGYVSRFLDVYGFAPAVAGAVALAFTGWRKRRARPLVLSALALAAYASFVGDWMRGFRLFVPVVPLLAVLVGTAVPDAKRLRLLPSAKREAAASGGGAPLALKKGPRAAWITAAAMSGWFLVAAVRFASANLPAIGGSWWTHRKAAISSYFGPYYRAVNDARRSISKGDRIASNQAGFIPFMLDADNFDSLGICSRFVAKLPVRDLVETEVGRYAPPTDEPVFRASEAYLLYLNPAIVLEPRDNLRSANRGLAPDAIFGGRYRAAAGKDDAPIVVYQRAGGSFDEFARDPDRFRENVAHPAYLQRAFIDDQRVDPREFLSRLAFLRGGITDRVLRGNQVYELWLAAADPHIFELYAQEIWVRLPTTIRFSLRRADGALVWTELVDLAADETRTLHVELSPPVKASRLIIEAAGPPGGENRVRFIDARLQGQTPELAAYVRQNLRFPAR